MNSEKLIELTVDITKAALSGAGEKSAHIVNNPNDVKAFMDAVHSKLVELNQAQQ